MRLLRSPSAGLAPVLAAALLFLLLASTGMAAEGMGGLVPMRLPSMEKSDLALRPQHGGLLQKLKAPRPNLSSVYAPSASAAAYKTGAIVVCHKGMAAGDELDDYESDPVSSIADPLEPWNRFWFHFNDIFFTYVARPAYRGWEAVTHEDIRSGLKNFWHNAMFPIRFVNNILQFRFLEAGAEFGKFIINTTTSAGFADVAKGKKTIVPLDPSGEDFGQTLGRWGIGHGIYLVWPFIGPSSLRETVGLAGDWFANPATYLSPWPLYYKTDVPWYTSTAIKSGMYFNALDRVFPLYDDMKGAAVDPYVAMREAYVKYRAIQVAR